MHAPHPVPHHDDRHERAVLLLLLLAHPTPVAVGELLDAMAAGDAAERDATVRAIRRLREADVLVDDARQLALSVAAARAARLASQA